jgi:hypothetical protein
LVTVESATIVAPVVPGETAVELNFNVPVTLPADCGMHAFGALKNPITTSTWTTPVLEDLNGDGKPDLVVADAMAIQVYLATGAEGGLAFQGDAITIATREVVDSTSTLIPTAHWDTAISFGDADNDGHRDLICGERWHGNVVYFPMLDQAYAPGQLREFGAQRTLKYEANGLKVKIAVATADYTTQWATFPLPPFGHDMAMAAPALIKYDADEFYDLVVADNIYGPQKHVIFWVFRYLGNDALNANAPYYAEAVPLTINGVPAVIPEVSGLAVPTFIDVDGENGLDLVVSAESGKVYVALNTGQSTPEGNIAFAPFDLVTIAGSPFDSGRTTAAIPVDADSDGDLDLLVSTLTEEGPSRRLIRLFRSVMSGSLSTLEQPGVTIGSGNTLLPFAPAAQWFSNVQMGKFNHDKFPDLIQGLQNGQIAISFSTDTGNNYDPVYSSPVLCRNASGGVFDITNFDVPDYTPRVSVYDADQDGHLDGLVLAVANKLYYCAHLCMDGDGCMVLADPVEIVVPAAVFASSTSSFLSVAFGDFTPGVGPDSLDGAILFKEAGFGINGVKGQEVYWLPLASLNPPQFGAATLLVPNTNDFTYPPAAPCLRDLDGDGDLDMITCPASVFVWWENMTGQGPVTSMVKRQTVIDAGNASVYASGAQSFCIFDWEDPTDSRPLVISPSKKFSDPQLPVQTRLYHLNGINSSGNLLVERHATKGLVQIEQTLASSVVQLSPTRFRMSVPVELLEGDQISVNRVLVNGAEVACRGITLGHWDVDGDGLSTEWEIANGTNPYLTDTDGDGLSDDAEVDFGLNPANPDSDGNGQPDSVETRSPKWFGVSRNQIYGFLDDSSSYAGGSLEMHGRWQDAPETFETLYAPIPYAELSARLDEQIEWPDPLPRPGVAALFSTHGNAVTVTSGILPIPPPPEGEPQPAALPPSTTHNANLEHRRNVVRLLRPASEPLTFRSIIREKRTINGEAQAEIFRSKGVTIPAGQRESSDPVDLQPGFEGGGANNENYSETVEFFQHRVLIEEVRFGEGGLAGANYHELKSDDLATTFDAPHWVDLDGDGKPRENASFVASAFGEKNYPVAFTRATKASVGARFKILDLPPGLTVKIKGSSAAGISLPEVEITPEADGTIIYPLTFSQSSFPDSIQFYNATGSSALRILWEVKFEESGWLTLGTTKHTVFLTLENPLASLKNGSTGYRLTLFWLACKNSIGVTGTPLPATANSIYLGTATFSDRTVQRFDHVTGGPIGLKLTYNELSNKAPGHLLVRGTGMCRNWSSFFYGGSCLSWN